MSHYSEVNIEIRDEAALIAALLRLGWTEQQIEIHQEAKHLYGYQGDMRSQKAHIIVRRKHISRSANDMGFERMPDGSIKSHISDFDRGVDDVFVGRLKQAYGIAKTKAEAQRRGYKTREEILKDGRIRLVCRR